jgi:hypothetical protein
MRSTYGWRKEPRRIRRNGGTAAGLSEQGDMHGR